MPKKTWINSLNRRLLLVFLVFGTLPLTVTGIVFLYLERQTLIEQAARELNGTSTYIARELDNYIDELLLDAQGIAALPDVRSMDPARQQEAMATLQALYNRYGQLAIVDLSGQILLTAQPQELVNIEGIESFQRAAGGEQSWFVAPGLFNSNLVMHMHTPIEGENERPLAVLGSPVPLIGLAQVLDAGRMDESCEIFVLDADNKVLIHPDLDKQLARRSYADLFPASSEAPPAPLPGADMVAPAGEVRTMPVSVSYTKDGQEMLLSYKTMDHLGWTVVIERPMSNVLAPTSTTGAIAFSTVMITLLLGNVMAIVLATRFTNPIRRLAEAAEGLKTGNPTVPLPNSGNQDREIKILLEAFDAMRTAVTEREQELRVLSTSLEERVQNRARELMLTNKRLNEEIEKHQLTAQALHQAKESAEAASRAKSVFLATMSHELRTPLTAIIGYGELLKEDAAFSSNPDAVEDLDTIVRSAHALLQIINDVLSLAKIEAERMDVDLKSFDLPCIVDDAVTATYPILQQNRNQLGVSISPDLGSHLQGDEVKVRQILLNLLSNAAKFTHDGQINLTITADRELPFLVDAAQWLVISVTDNGIGIPYEKQARLFEPFMQVDNAKSRKYSGTGLGLAITKRLCHILGGDIYFESMPRHGSTFTVRLPLHQEAVKQV